MVSESDFEKFMSDYYRRSDHTVPIDAIFLYLYRGYSHTKITGELAPHSKDSWNISGGWLRSCGISTSAPWGKSEARGFLKDVPGTAHEIESLVNDFYWEADRRYLSRGVPVPDKWARDYWHEVRTELTHGSGAGTRSSQVASFNTEPAEQQSSGNPFAGLLSSAGASSLRRQVGKIQDNTIDRSNGARRDTKPVDPGKAALVYYIGGYLLTMLLGWQNLYWSLFLPSIAVFGVWYLVHKKQNEPTKKPKKPKPVPKGTSNKFQSINPKLVAAVYYLGGYLMAVNNDGVWGETFSKLFIPSVLVFYFWIKSYNNNRQ